MADVIYVRGRKYVGKLDKIENGIVYFTASGLFGQKMKIITHISKCVIQRVNE